MDYACPHCATNLKGKLVRRRHINMLRAELICPSCEKPIELNKSGLEVWYQPLIWLPGIPFFKLWFSDDPPLWGWIVTGIFTVFSIFGGYYLWKKHLRDWPRYAKVKTL